MRFLALLLVLSGCTLTYTPILREARAPEPRLVVGQGALAQADEALQARASADGSLKPTGWRCSGSTPPTTKCGQPRCGSSPAPNRSRS